MTGATGVLGKSISTYFACQGAKVVILVRERSAEKGEALSAEIRALGGEAASYVADVMSKSSLEAAYNWRRRILFLPFAERNIHPS